MVLAIRKVSKTKQVIMFMNKGLKNKVTLMGKIKRFERRKPKVARLVKFYIIFFSLGVMSLSLMPGSQLPFQKRLKIKIFHIKSWFNYYWNYEIGKEKENYLYLELQNLLMEMNGHQIYDIDQIHRVFTEVENVLNEDFQTLKFNLQRQLKKQSEDIYLSTNKDQQKLNTSLKQISQNSSKILSNQTLQPKKSTIVNKRNELKQKIKAQIESKYQQQKPQNKIQKQPVNKLNSEDKKVEFKNNKNSVQENKQQKISENKIKKQKQIDLRNIFWNSLTFSPNFNSNMLMYYVIILENAIRSQTQLLKNPKFYQIYQKAVQNFIFNMKVENFLQQNSINKNSSLKELNQKLERQIHFLKVLRRSSMTGNNRSNGDSEVIDPHKLMTYLINYRHLMENNQFASKNNIQNNEKLTTQKSQSQKIKQMLVNYKSMIESKDDQKDQKSLIQNNKIDTDQNSSKLIEMAIKNKSFINSLKQLYIESINKQNQQSSSNQPNKTSLKNNKKPNKIKQQIKNDQQLKSQPTYKIIESIFGMFDQWYSTINQEQTKKK